MPRRHFLPTNSLLVALIAVIFVAVAIGLPSCDGQALLGSIMVMIVLVVAAVMLIRAGRRRDARRLIGAEIFEDPKTAAKNRASGVTTFSLTYQDSSHEFVTVRDGSIDYNQYLALGRPEK